MHATREARKTLILFARIGMNDPSRLEVYMQRLKNLEQAERRIRNTLRRQNQAPSPADNEPSIYVAPA